jgi:hypothetical protein
MTTNPVSAVASFSILRSTIWRVAGLLSCLVSIAAADVSGNFTYTDNGSTITITEYAPGAPTDVVIPAQIDIDPSPSVENFKTVTTIGNGAFGFRDDLTSVSIPDSVTSIETKAFFYCTGLVSATLSSNL